MCSEPRRSPRPSPEGPSRRRATARLAPAVLALLLAPLLLPLAACGKKGDPSPPLRHVPRTTDKLVVQQRGHGLLLELPYPTTTTAGMALEGLQRVEVWEVVRPVSTSFRDLVDPDWPREVEEEILGEEEVENVVSEGEPREPTNAAHAAELGIVGADEVDEFAARRDVAEEAAEAAKEAQSDDPPGDIGPEAEDEELLDEEALAAEPLDAAVLEQRRRAELLRPLEPRPFQLAAELRATLSGDDLKAAVVGDTLQIRLPLPRPLPDDPRIHYLAVRTVSVQGDESALSNQARIVPLEPPPAPRQLRADARGDGIEISWEPQGPEIVGYNLYRRNARFRTFENPVAVPTEERTSYLDRTVQVGETYIYAITAVAQRQPLVESEVAEVREVDYRDRFAPPAPESAVALAEDDRVRLVWEGSEAPDLAGYLVWRQVGPDGDFRPVTPEPLGSTEYVDTDLESGVRYTYRVVAVDEVGNESDPAVASTVAR